MTLTLPGWIAILILLVVGYFLIWGSLILGLLLFITVGQRCFPLREGRRTPAARWFDMATEAVAFLCSVWSYPARLAVAFLTPS